MVMLLLGFLLVIAASLTIWAALTVNEHAGAPPRAAEAERPAMPLAGVEPPSNDDVRGARALVTRRPTGSDDAFERFLRSDSRRDETDF